jgi:hypothetical protein
MKSCAVAMDGQSLAPFHASFHGAVWSFQRPITRSAKRHPASVLTHRSSQVTARPRKLRERHAEVLIEARKRFDFVFAPVTRYAATKRRQWQVFYDLREHQLAHVH